MRPSRYSAGWALVRARFCDYLSGCLILRKAKYCSMTINGFHYQCYEKKFVWFCRILFADNLSENIAYDNPSRDPSKILDIARAAALDDTVESFPEGSTPLGERETALSGGQKQRTALARSSYESRPFSYSMIAFLQWIPKQKNESSPD